MVDECLVLSLVLLHGAGFYCMVFSGRSVPTTLKVDDSVIISSSFYFSGWELYSQNSARLGFGPGFDLGLSAWIWIFGKTKIGGTGWDGTGR